jgi:hypothetical protein
MQTLNEYGMASRPPIAFDGRLLNARFARLQTLALSARH